MVAVVAVIAEDVTAVGGKQVGESVTEISST